MGSVAYNSKNGNQKQLLTGQLKPQRFTFPRFQWLLQQRSRRVVDHFLHLGGNAQGPWGQMKGMQAFQAFKIEPEVSKTWNKTHWSHIDMSFQQKSFNFLKPFWIEMTYEAKQLRISCEMASLFTRSLLGASFGIGIPISEMLGS